MCVMLLYCRQSGEVLKSDDVNENVDVRVTDTYRLGGRCLNDSVQV